MQTEILVIGSGPAGTSVAYQCAEAGKKVAMVDRLFGGTCALRGCTPKKAMESVTSKFWAARAMQKAGFPLADRYVNWHELSAHQSKFTTLVPAQKKKSLENAGIKVLKGSAAFVDAHTVKVGNKKVKADKIVIATGARPRPLTIPGEEFLITNDGFFALDHLPEKVVIVGGGYIAFEFSHIMAACGAEVTILSKEEMPLGVFDADLVSDLVEATLAKGIEVKLGYVANKIEKTDSGFTVTSERTDGDTFLYEADLAIHAAGRVPNADHLGIEQIGLSLNEKQGIEVNDYLQTEKHAHIYALGDVTGQLPFTEVATYEAEIVAHNILSRKRKAVDYTGVPFGVFTYPKLAMVGKSEKELKKAGIKYEVKTESRSDSFTERTQLNSFARYKTLVDKKTKKILGAGILASHADDMINLFSLGIQKGMTVKDFEDSFLLYPTAGHDVKHFF